MPDVKCVLIHDNFQNFPFVYLFVYRQRNKTLSLLVGACDVETAPEIFALFTFAKIDFGHLDETAVIEQHSVC